MGVVHCRFEPVGPYDLAASARALDGVTQRRGEDVLEVALVVGCERGAYARIRQRRDGSIEAMIEADDRERAHAALRRTLALDLDPTPFVRAVRGDRLLRDLVRRRPGLRPLGTGTVTHALLRGLAGQLIAFVEAQRIERRILRAAVPAEGPDGLRPSPDRQALIDLGANAMVRAGLAGRRAEALLGTLRGFDPERLHVATDADVTARLTRQPQIGPWTVGVVGLHGLGRGDLGLIGDLGLMRLLAQQTGRWPSAHETEELLAPYAPWRGLASLHLLGHPDARRRPTRVSAPETIRTSDTRLRRPVLYPLSYGGGGRRG
jgi:DNA-3-methyladenine glycosylase II